ncbi:MAG: hypothetical protein GY838_11575 [bacterium]|nr:hypothetical protein [bacterium]
MRRLILAGAYAAFLAVAALGYYEWTAKSPAILGTALPGWYASRAAEKATRWQRPTGLLVVDKALHEGEEAMRFYGLLR